MEPKDLLNKWTQFYPNAPGSKQITALLATLGQYSLTDLKLIAHQEVVEDMKELILKLVSCLEEQL
jgi:hypothetical protein